MKFKDLFKKSAVPKKDGKSQDLQISEGLKTYYITLSNLDDSPSYDLLDVLSIGSQSADVIVEDPSIAPKHCTFFNNNGVISIIDHTSENGTFVNEKQIPSARMIILKDEDFIRAGELELEIGFEVIEPSAPLNIEPSQKIESQESDGPDKQVISAPIDSTQEINIEQLNEAPQTAPAAMASEDKTGEIVVDELSLEQEDSSAQDLELSADSESTAEIDVKAINTNDEQSIDVSVEEQFENALEDEKKSKGGFFKRLFSKKKKEDSLEDESEDSSQESSQESEEQPPKEKKPSFVARLFSRKKKEKPREVYKPEPKKRKSFKSQKKPSKPKVAKDDFASANAFSRMIGFFAEILLTATVFFIFKETNEFKELMEQIDKVVIDTFNTHLKVHFDAHLAVHWQKIPAIALKALNDGLVYRNLLFLYLALKVLFTLILGVGFAQALTGLGAAGNSIWKRFGGVLREVLGVILLPLNVFDFLTLFGVKPIREMLTFTKVTVRSKLSFLFGLFIGLPLLAICLLISPVVKNAQLISPILISDLKKVSEKKNNTEKNQIKDYDQLSNYFQIQLAAEKISDFLIYPSFELRVGQSEKIIMNSIAFESIGQDLKVNVSVVKKSILSKLLYKAVQFDPMIQLKFPKIKEYALDASTVNSNFKKAKLNKIQKKQLNTEIKQYLKLAFGLSIEGLINHIPEYGPFLMGYVNVKDELIESSQLDFVDSVSFEKINGSEFIVLSSSKSLASGTTEYVYIPIDSPSMNILKFKVRALKLNPKKIKFFKDKILGNMKVMEEVSKPIKLQDKSYLNSFELFDYSAAYFSQKNDLETTQLVNQYLFENLFNTAKKVISVDKQRLSRRLESSISKTIKSLEVLNEKREEKDFDLLIKKLSELLGALKDKNTEYFGTNLRA